MPLATRSTTGCFMCRRRHKKCDEVRPVCAGCGRNRLLCSWPSPTSTALASRPDEPRSYPNCEAGLASAPPAVSAAGLSFAAPLPPVFRVARNRTLLQHYADVTSQYLASRVHPVNPYLTYNIQVAWDCVELQHVLLALSCCQLSCATTLALAQESMTHYLVALRGLKHAITGWGSRRVW
ncbi:hypothetical protein B0J12DRAFT_674522 [Macrophomina phaseolina]|uniref:Zn(2)-C6 fungal-type domain-containing protein n=1 Tax=Macrophomina phaseolina TaxID=35725 RepID=A0ABQ8G1X8_9PEZI|nr:hypothetical protein B0J12DRAFT_674522 [Macrophomina phaseolina]